MLLFTLQFASCQDEKNVDIEYEKPPINEQFDSNKKLKACIMVIQDRLSKDSSYFEEVRKIAKVEQLSNEKANERIVSFLLSNCSEFITLSHANEVIIIITFYFLLLIILFFKIDFIRISDRLIK